MEQTKLVIGLMSGTSLDGVDAALVQIDGSGPFTQIQLKHFVSVPFETPVQTELLRVASGTAVPTQVVSHLNFLLGRLYTEAVFKVCEEARIKVSEVDLIGCHGQTVFHQSEPGSFCGYTVASTLQIGEASFLAEGTGITTVCDFRPRDMAAGGKGAPLIPYVDYVLFRDLRLGRALLNIGGIANVTSLPAEGCVQQVTAFDTGPGNMVIDALVRHFTNGEKRYDHDGTMASRGQVVPELLDRSLSHPYFQAFPPKTAGREQFGEAFVSTMLAFSNTASVDDLICTATELTVQSVARAIIRFVIPQTNVDQLIVSGGGARNGFLMTRLQAVLPKLQVLSSDAVGVPAGAKEAIGFAILANETFHLHSGNLPSATGARRPVVLGKVIYGDNYKSLRGMR